MLWLALGYRFLMLDCFVQLKSKGRCSVLPQHDMMHFADTNRRPAPFLIETEVDWIGGLCGRGKVVVGNRRGGWKGNYSQDVKQMSKLNVNNLKKLYSEHHISP